MKCDCRYGGNVQAVEPWRHRDADCLQPIEQPARKTLAFSAEVERHPVRSFDVPDVDGASGGEGYLIEAVGIKRCGQLIWAAAGREWNLERRAHRDTDRLAVKRVASGIVNEHGMCAECCRVPENRTHIVMIGNAHQSHDKRALR